MNKATTPIVNSDFDNHEIIKNNSSKAKLSAIATLELAKKQEAEKINNGYHFAMVNSKTYILTKSK